MGEDEGGGGVSSSPEGDGGQRRFQQTVSRGAGDGKSRCGVKPSPGEQGVSEMDPPPL